LSENAQLQAFVVAGFLSQFQRRTGVYFTFPAAKSGKVYNDLRLFLFKGILRISGNDKFNIVR